MMTVSVMKDSFGSTVLVPEFRGQTLGWSLVLPSCPERESVDGLGLDHSVYEVPSTHLGSGGRWIFFLCVHSSLPLQGGAKRLRKSPVQTPLLPCFPGLAGDSGEGRWLGEPWKEALALRVPRQRGFLERASRPKAAMDHLPVPHPRGRRLAVGWGRRERETQAPSPSLQEKGCHLTALTAARSS